MDARGGDVSLHGCPHHLLQVFVHLSKSATASHGHCGGLGQWHSHKVFTVEDYFVKELKPINTKYDNG